MNAPTDAPLGLRERKKLKLRRTIRAEALRLFEAQGYEQTTVEQIADAAETSTTTFYRYFPTKEDVVLIKYDDLIEGVLLTLPANESLADSVRGAAARVVAAGDAARGQSLARLRLMASVPALTARYAAEERKTVDVFTRFFAERTGRTIEDFRLNVTAAALVAALFTSTRRWGAEGGATPLSSLLEEAITLIEPLLSALDQVDTCAVHVPTRSVQ